MNLTTEQIIRLYLFMRSVPSQEDIEQYYIKNIMPYDSKHSIAEILRFGRERMIVWD